MTDKRDRPASDVCVWFIPLRGETTSSGISSHTEKPSGIVRHLITVVRHLPDLPTKETRPMQNPNPDTCGRSPEPSDYPTPETTGTRLVENPRCEPIRPV